MPFAGPVFRSNSANGWSQAGVVRSECQIFRSAQSFKHWTLVPVGNTPTGKLTSVWVAPDGDLYVSEARKLYRRAPGATTFTFVASATNGRSIYDLYGVDQTLIAVGSKGFVGFWEP